jgi:hypothetical protein
MYLTHDSRSGFHIYELASLSMPRLFNLTSCTFTKYNIYLDSSFESAATERILRKLLTLHVENFSQISLT